MKKAVVVCLVFVLLLCLCGCGFKGYDFLDTNYHFNKAIIKMPSGETIEVEIDTWADAEGEQLTITTKDGVRYLVSSLNCILIEDGGNCG